MTRAIEADMLSSIAAQSGREILHLISIDLETVGVLYLCTAPHDVDWNTHTWEGIGGAIGFEAITEIEDKKAGQVGIKVSGVDQQRPGPTGRDLFGPSQHGNRGDHLRSDPDVPGVRQRRIPGR